MNDKTTFESINSMWILRMVAILFCIHFSLLTIKAQTISGIVQDAETGEAVPMTSCIYRGHGVAVASDVDGNFKIGRHQGWPLTFSAVGYLQQTVIIDAKTPAYLRIKLRPDNKMLKEVTIKSKKQRYSRKNNPAVEMMKKVIAAKKQVNLANHDYYQYNKYQKITLAFNDVTPQMLESSKLGKKQWLINQIEPCKYNNKLILPVSVDETVSQKIYRKDPHDEKTIIKGINSTGINDLIQTGDILTSIMKDVFADINIYEDPIRILRNPFNSPIGDGAISFYRYYIEDTVYVDRDLCFHLSFLPNNPQDFGFRGQLFVLADSSWQVKRCEMTIPRYSDVNFVDNMQVVQEFTKLPTGEWVLSVDDMFTELRWASFLQQFAVIRNTRLTDYAFDPLPKQLFKGKKKEVKDVNAMMQGDDFWKQYRQVELTKSENSMDQFVHGLEQIKGFNYIIFVAKAFIENFVETGSAKTPSKVDIGPINTMITNNFIDGMRNRISAQTTANLDSNFFASGYIAHGWGSKKTYYRGDLIWSFNKKEYLPREFPKRTLTLSSTYDVMSPSDKFLRTDKDNVFTSFKWAKVDKMMFYNRQSLTFEREEDWGFRTTLAMKTEENEGVGELFFIPLSQNPDKSTWTNWSHPTPEIASLPATTAAPSESSPSPGTLSPPATYVPTPSRSIRTTEIRGELRFAPGETFINTKQRRLPINLNAPVFTIGHSMGLKGVLGGEYNYNLTEVSVFKRIWLRSWGKIDCHLKGGIQWNQVPFPLLIMPETNLSYILQDYTFMLVNNMEFLNDRYAAAIISWDMHGKLFNRIPLLKRLKWREWLSVRCYWGELSDKNNPYLPQNANSDVLMYFPERSYIMDRNRPYWELSAGIHNIFKLIHVEYVRRMNYLDLPTANKQGVRFMMRMTF